MIRERIWRKRGTGRKEVRESDHFCCIPEGTLSSGGTSLPLHHPKVTRRDSQDEGRLSEGIDQQLPSQAKAEARKNTALLHSQSSADRHTIMFLSGSLTTR